MKLRTILLASLFIFMAFGSLSFAAVDVSAQSRFDSGDTQDDAGSDFDSGDSTTNTDGSSSDNSDSTSSGGNSNTGSDGSDSTSSTSNQQQDTDTTSEDSSRFDSGDSEDDAGSDSDTTSDESDSTSSEDSSRFDSGDSEDDAGDDGSRFDSGDSEDDSSDAGNRFDSGDSEDDSNQQSEDEQEQQEEETPDEESSDDESEDDTGEEEPSDQEQGESTSGQSAGGGGNVIGIDPLQISDEDISLQVSPSQVASGQQVTISGSIDSNRYIAGLPVNVLLNGEQVDTVQVSGDRTFSTTLSSDQQGSNTVAVEFHGASASTSFQVGSGELRIIRTTTSGAMNPGESIQVCSVIQSSADAEISFFANEKLQETRTGTGEQCFNHVLESGSNTFRIEASVGGETVTDTVTRNANVFSGGQGGVPDGAGGGITGDFAANVPDLPSLPGFDLTNLGVRWLFSVIIALLLAGGILL